MPRGRREVVFVVLAETTSRQHGYWIIRELRFSEKFEIVRIRFIDLNIVIISQYTYPAQSLFHRPVLVFFDAYFCGTFVSVKFPLL